MPTGIRQMVIMWMEVGDADRYIVSGITGLAGIRL